MTLAVRQSMLPHDLQYCLDGASEAGEITSAADIAVRLYGEADELDRIWNQSSVLKTTAAERLAGVLDHGPQLNWQNERRNRALEVERYGARLIVQLSPARRKLLVIYGVASICRHIRELSDWLARSNFEDETKGGCMKHYRDRWLLGRDMQPTKKVARRLRSPKVIRHYVGQQDEIGHQRKLLRTLLTSIPLDGTEIDSAAETAALNRDLDGQLTAHRIAQRQAIESQRWRERFENEPGAALPDNVKVRLKMGAKKLAQLRRERRRTARRGAVLAAALLGASAVSAFARGEPVMLKAPDSEVAISARLTGFLATSGHGALSINVHSAADGHRLASLCLYQEAPAIDQLVSLALHCHSGNIADVLESGNLFAVEPGAETFAQIASRRPPPAGEPRPFPDDGIMRPPVGRRLGDQELFRNNVDFYVNAFLPVYAEAMATIIFGHAVPYWRKQAPLLLRIGLDEGEDGMPGGVVALAEAC